MESLLGWRMATMAMAPRGLAIEYNDKGAGTCFVQFEVPGYLKIMCCFTVIILAYVVVSINKGSSRQDVVCICYIACGFLQLIMTCMCQQPTCRG